MAQHELHLDIPKGIEVVNVDVDFTVKSDGAKLGTLKVSKGGVD